MSNGGLFTAAALLGFVMLLGVAKADGSPQWEPVPLVTREARTAGRFGGEGGQWPQAIAADGAGRFLLFGTDVGGVFRSLDGGARWEPCNVGYTPRGNTGLAIDPRNSRRCLAVGANSATSDFHGLYLSTDQAASWKQVLKANISGYRDLRDQIAYDPATFDPAKGYTTVVYWSRIAEDKPHSGQPDLHPALYRSVDGGRTWAEIPNTASIGGSRLKVHPHGGVLYAANKNGFFRSADGGKTFSRTLDGEITGLDVSRAAPDTVYLSRADGVWRSADAGRTFRKIAGSAAIANGDVLRGIKVSPADANRLVLWREGANWNWVRFASRDGGATWKQARFDNTDAFLPYNARQGLFAWHPTDPNVAWSTGGDWPTKSTDGGATWRYAGDGYNVVLVGGMWNFNQQDPDVLFFGSQDYNGALTTDGGRTWQYRNPSGNGWGGFCYGGYAASARTLVVGNAAGWGNPRELKVSRDGGTTWAVMRDAAGKPLVFVGPDVSFGDPTDKNVVFASNYRSADGGATWAAMAGCEAVLTASPTGARELYGKRTNKEVEQTDLVVSRDRGVTWTRLASLPGNIDDIACDTARRRLYVAGSGGLKYWQDGAWTTVTGMPKDQWGGNRIRSVAVDPVNPAVVYAASNRDLFSTGVAVVRSTDAGATWSNLTLNAPLDGKRRDGGREALCVRVHPKTRHAWVSTSCYGIWKISPP